MDILDGDQNRIVLLFQLIASHVSLSVIACEFRPSIIAKFESTSNRRERPCRSRGKFNANNR